MVTATWGPCASQVVPVVGSYDEAWGGIYRYPTIYLYTPEPLLPSPTAPWTIAVNVTNCLGLGTTTLTLQRRQNTAQTYSASCVGMRQGSSVVSSAVPGKDIQVYVPPGALPLVWDTSTSAFFNLPYNPNFNPNLSPWCGTQPVPAPFSRPRLPCVPWAPRFLGNHEAWNLAWPATIYVTVDMEVTTDKIVAQLCNCVAAWCVDTFLYRVDTIYFAQTCDGSQAGTDITVSIRAAAMPGSVLSYVTPEITFTMQFDYQFHPGARPWCGSAPQSPFVVEPRWECDPGPTPGPSVPPVNLGAFSMTIEALGVLGAGPWGTISRALVHDATSDVTIFFRPRLFYTPPRTALGVLTENCNTRGLGTDTATLVPTTRDIVLVCRARVAAPIRVGVPAAAWTLQDEEGHPYQNYNLEAGVQFVAPPLAPGGLPPGVPINLTWVASNGTRGVALGSLLAASNQTKVVWAALGAGGTPHAQTTDPLVAAVHGGFLPALGFTPTPAFLNSTPTTFLATTTGCSFRPTNFTRIQGTSTWTTACTMYTCANIMVGNGTLPCNQGLLPLLASPFPLPSPVPGAGSPSASFVVTASASGTPPRSPTGSSTTAPSRSGSRSRAVPSATRSPSVSPSTSNAPLAATLQSPTTSHDGPGYVLDLTLVVSRGVPSRPIAAEDFRLQGGWALASDNLFWEDLPGGATAYSLPVLVAEPGPEDALGAVVCTLPWGVFSVAGTKNPQTRVTVPYRPRPTALVPSAHNGSRVTAVVVWAWDPRAAPPTPPHLRVAVSSPQTLDSIAVNVSDHLWMLTAEVGIHPAFRGDFVIHVPSVDMVDAQNLSAPLPGINLVVHDTRPTPTSMPSASATPSTTKHPSLSPSPTKTRSGSRSTTPSRTPSAPISTPSSTRTPSKPQTLSQSKSQSQSLTVAMTPKPTTSPPPSAPPTQTKPPNPDSAIAIACIIALSFGCLVACLCAKR